MTAMPLNKPGCVGWSGGKYSGWGELSVKHASPMGMHTSTGLPFVLCTILPSSLHFLVFTIQSLVPLGIWRAEHATPSCFRGGQASAETKMLAIVVTGLAAELIR